MFSHRWASGIHDGKVAEPRVSLRCFWGGLWYFLSNGVGGRPPPPEEINLVGWGSRGNNDGEVI